MPVSKKRKKDLGYQAPPTMGEHKIARLGSPRWLAPLMVACFVVGLIYIVVYYIAGPQIGFMNAMAPILNVGIGFGFIIVGFFLSTKWQ
ncbi:MAG: cell division protein CrgA [Candidatus Nanopelagicales bacterium]|nr:cell division protein CrgA [Candidatus Nanopelagicales bacterium]